MQKCLKGGHGMTERQNYSNTAIICKYGFAFRRGKPTIHLNFLPRSIFRA